MVAFVTAKIVERRMARTPGRTQRLEGTRPARCAGEGSLHHVAARVANSALPRRSANRRVIVITLNGDSETGQGRAGPSSGLIRHGRQTALS